MVETLWFIVWLCYILVTIQVWMLFFWRRLCICEGNKAIFVILLPKHQLLIITLHCGFHFAGSFPVAPTWRVALLTPDNHLVLCGSWSSCDLGCVGPAGSPGRGELQRLSTLGELLLGELLLLVEESVEALETKKPGERQPCQTGEYVQRSLVPHALTHYKILSFTTIFRTMFPLL